ncbi:AAA family ATPase [Enterobacter cloacae]|uniref:AAA family ATPase n=1 Tax=Enterobacter cloacae TaxID=550 RepID=UPI00101B20C6|nr:AAA family ATPase [Enterobacter cloacae]QBC03354.1 AAA family ATPase [Enterobacter cloacae]
MTTISREKLFGKLSDFSYRAMAQGTELCRSKGHPYVEVVHWLHQVLRQPDSDLHRTLAFFAISPRELAQDVQQALARLPTRATSDIDFSLQLEELVERGWLCGELQFDATRIRTVHLLLGALATPVLRNALLAISRSFSRVDGDRLAENLSEILADSPENITADEPKAGVPQQGIDKETAIARFTVDLTAAARSGKLDPVYGRSREIRLLMDILMRRRQNNPLLAGEAGVGKTAVVEGLALMIAAGESPPQLKDARILTLDISLMLAGAGVKGEFEQRLRQLTEEIQNSALPTLLFIDEVHTLIGAGGQAGTGDAANLLKPMLARGALRTIGATTWREYKKHIEKDPALKRRFQVVRINEPEPDAALLMLRSAVPALEKHHCVRIQASALTAAVTLSHRYLPERQLPDKAMSLLDTACAGAQLAQVTPPPRLAELRELAAAQDAELRQAQQEGGQESLAALQEALTESNAALAQLEAEWQAAQRQTAAEVRVDGEAVAAVLQTWTGIPLATLQQDELDTLTGLAQRLSQRVLGQPQAMEAIARRIQTARAGLDQPEKPVGVFLLAGPSGVGKTETALALAELLYGGEQQLITINMSEYQEAHSVALLKGAPPGYVGYGEGGVLTEAVRRRPHSVVLLDEIEKAHPDVHELFFQVFDKGRMEDAEGNVIDFRNSLILMTSNLGAEEIQRLGRRGSPDELEEALQGALLQAFPAAFIGRLIAVPYQPLDEAMLTAIVSQRLARIAERVRLRYQAELNYDAELVAYLVQRCTQSASGGRKVDALLTQELLPKLSMCLLTHRHEQAGQRKCHLSFKNSELSLIITG